MTIDPRTSDPRGAGDWYARAGEIIRHAGLPSLPRVLVGALREVVGFEHSAIFGYVGARRPAFLFDGFAGLRQRSAVAAYLNGTYLLDPFYDACVRRVAPGLYRMRDLAPDAFFDAVGAHPGYVSPCVSDRPGVLSEEIGFFARNAQEAYLVLSLMRAHDEPAFDAAEFAWLTRIAPVVLAAMEQHWRGLGAPECEAASGPRVADTVEHLFRDFGAPLLTAREREVAQLVLRGHSSGSIAARLGIAPATVKIHRRNLYEKLGVGSQPELFALFIDLLAAHGSSEAGP